MELFLCGDVMLGRGVDQILPNAGDPRLNEPYMHDARAYVDLAEKASGEIPRPVDFGWPWGEALPVLDALAPDVRIVNLETCVSRSADFDAGKSVHYRMSPGNIESLTVARPDVCALANNHVLDFGRPGLSETLEVLSGAGIQSAGAGRDQAEAARPTVVQTRAGHQVVVFSVATTSSGVPSGWQASRHSPGIAVAQLHGSAAASLVADVNAAKRSGGDVVVVSIHWGGNWGYDVPAEQVEFAHRLVDAGADVVHGHSSHHPRPVEVYRGKLILYGCGDFINDYEGISGYEQYRDDLRLLYLAALDVDGGRLTDLRMVPMRACQLRLELATDADAEWLAATLGDVSASHGVRIELASLPTSAASVPVLRVRR